MGRINNDKYTIPNLSKNFLERNGFKFAPNISNAEDGVFYRYSFPVMKYMDFVTLYAEITVNLTYNIAIIDVIDTNRSRYAPYYYYEYGNYDQILQSIDSRIDKYIKKLGMVKIDEHDNGESRELFDLPTRNSDRGKQKGRKSKVWSQKQGISMGTENPLRGSGEET